MIDTENPNDSRQAPKTTEVIPMCRSCTVTPKRVGAKQGDSTVERTCCQAHPRVSSPYGALAFKALLR